MGGRGRRGNPVPNIPPPAPVVQIQRRAKDPPCFEGKPQEDVVAWLEEYQDTADFNLWAPEDSLHHVKWALKGLAKNWYRNLNPPPVTFPQFILAIRTAFKHPAYDSGVAAQLRARKQGLDESPVMYCFDKLNLCNRVDPGMGENVKLEHLIQGLKPTLVEKIYPFIDFANPNTAAFVQLVQLHHQATWVANSNGWAPKEAEQPAIPQMMLTQEQSGPAKQFVTQDQLVTFEKQLTSKLETNLRGELIKHKRELQQELKDIQEKGFSELLTSVGKTVRQELQNSHSQKSSGGNLGKRQRTEDGRPICYKCDKAGHLARNCYSQTGRNGFKQNQGGSAASQKGANEATPPPKN